MTTINDGWYDAKAKRWHWKQASTGTWQLEIWFALSEHGQEICEMPGWFAVTDNTIAKRVEQFIALGYAPVTGDIGQEIGCDDAGVCFGGLDTNAVRVVVKTEANNQGVEKQKVDNIVAQKAKGAAAPVDTGALRAFGAQLRGAVLAAAAASKAAPAGGAQASRPTAQPARTPQAATRPMAQPVRGPSAQPQPVTGFGPAADDDCPF